MEILSITAGTWFWFFVPIPLLVVWAIITFIKEGREEE
ncbi:hypothetical protein SAMN05216498_1554 [Tenuibacillus multivorans]|uniref:Uncharacterized protein n=1 Tax=Tenuibacillus multivorans TaxID=237069 RepID=A0A1G9Z5W4_9BACI|nr:hypothetical protein SAMN05216498_1554 [Tenuibacillus multivorans]